MYNITWQEAIYVAIFLILCLVLFLIFKSPFHYPYFKHSFDISGKRNTGIENLIDIFLNEKKFFIIQKHEDKIVEWKKCCQKRIEKSIFKKYRMKQYKKSLNDDKAYIFCLTRQQTRYKQINYTRIPYKVTQTIAEYSFSYKYLLYRNEQLGKIKNECTIKEYNSKNQRKLMTKDLRQKIKVRDNYTCQICGKYMPDEVGLHIDHIQPIAKGGKTVPSNLQVLCSKCNGKKSAK